MRLPAHVQQTSKRVVNDEVPRARPRAPAGSLGAVNTLAAAAAYLFAAVAVSAEPAVKPLAARAADVTLEIRSYGEQPQELIELLVPFFAKYQFAETLPRRPSGSGLAQAIFKSSNLPNSPSVPATIITTGNFNCVAVDFYLMDPRRSIYRPYRDKNVDLFRSRLVQFIFGLPAPQPTIREIGWTSADRCSGAP